MPPTNMSVGNVCRACLARNADIDVNSSESGLPLIQLLSRCCGVDIAAEGLPEVVCGNCCAKLIQFREFGVKALRAHQSLLVLRGNANNDIASKLPTAENRILNAEGANKEFKMHKSKTKKAKRKRLKIDIEAAYKSTEADESYNKASDVRGTSDHDDCDVELSHQIYQSKKNTEEANNGRLESNKIEVEINMTSEYGERSQHRRQRRTEGTAHVCERCGYRAADRCSLRVHMRFHTGERPFPCTQCHKTFTIASNLKAHLRVHSGERPYVCEHCGRAFNTAASLRGHARTHSGERPYACADCPKTFAMLSNLRQHGRVHSGVKPYACDICCKPFSSSSDARAHRRTHTGERPYACAACPRRFALSSNLRAHTRTHQAAPTPRAHACAHCGLQFTHKSTLSAHVRTHASTKQTEVGAHACGVCGKRFARKCNLVVHKRRKKGCSGAQQQSTNQNAMPTTHSALPTNQNTVPTNHSAVPTNYSAVPTNRSAVPTKQSSGPTNHSSEMTNRSSGPTNQSAELTNQRVVPTNQSQTVVHPCQNVIVQSQQIITPDNKLQLGRQPLRTSIALVQIAGSAVAVRAEPQRLSTVTAVLPLTLVPVSILR